MSGLDEVFGSFPERPDHPNFWRLSEIILRLDAAASDDPDLAWEKEIAKWIHNDSLVYTSVQRAMRPLRVVTVGDARKHMKEIAIMSTLWMEGFLVGNEFAEKQKNEPQ